MWWLIFMDPEDVVKVIIISVIFAILFLIGYWIWGPDLSSKNKIKYDTVQNDSVIILKKKCHYIFDTVEQTDSTLVLKRKIIY